MPNRYKAYFRSPIGLIEITGSNEAIESVNFTEKQQSTPVDYPDVINHCIKELDEYFKGQRKNFTVTVSPEGTKFQKKVWKELQKIPFGRTVTYLDIAKKVSTAGSTRAVGGANGKNKIAIIIPCHRVIGHDNNLVGYAGGIKRKQWLLDHEAAVLNPQPLLFEQ